MAKPLEQTGCAQKTSAPLIQEVGGYVRGTHERVLPPLYCDPCPASDAEEAATDDQKTLNASKACATAELDCDSCPPRNVEVAASYDQTVLHAQSPPVRTTRAWLRAIGVFCCGISCVPEVYHAV